ncbi:MAG: polysaccharide pyruvyl transferase family protein, partial [Ruthenibacterium sp.]
GDQAQILAIDYLYREMGIAPEEIVYIDKDALPFYDGEPVLLPVSMPLVDYKEGGISEMFSPKITPVFLGLTLAKDTLLPGEVAYYKQHEPVGCRDERCYDILRGYGIQCYLGGCITVLLPERTQDSARQTKIFVIDPTEKLKPSIPAEIAKNAIWDTHFFYGPMPNPKERAAARYRRYSEEAALVITSLLHVSVPCMAMGIPLVLAKDLVSYRFAWLEALMKIYLPEQYPSINWHPAPVVYTAHKQRVRQMVLHRLRGINDAAEIQEIHDFYMQRERKPYVVDAFLPLQRFIDKTWLEPAAPYRYAVWGLTQMAELTVSYIQKHYPNAKLCHVYD